MDYVSLRYNLDKLLLSEKIPHILFEKGLSFSLFISNAEFILYFLNIVVVDFYVNHKGAELNREELGNGNIKGLSKI
jgi:hypothetical protein